MAGRRWIMYSSFSVRGGVSALACLPCFGFGCNLIGFTFAVIPEPLLLPLPPAPVALRLPPFLFLVDLVIVAKLAIVLFVDDSDAVK